MKDLYKQNPFAILQLNPSATKSEIIEKSKELEVLIDIGEIRDISKAQVIEARRQLLITQNRIKEEIFYYFLKNKDISELKTTMNHWLENPLLEEVTLDSIREEWTDEEIKNDFTPINEPNQELNTNGERFDDLNLKIQPKDFLMELPIPIIELNENF